jgi:hypothetical protein
MAHYPERCSEGHPDCSCADVDYQYAKESYTDLARNIGEMTDAKGTQYGNATEKVAEIIAILYPNGIPPFAYRNSLLIVRVLDKLCRLANQGEDGVDKGGEDPWRDVAGYALIGARK